MYEYLKSLEKDSIEFITESAFCEYEIEKQRIENDYNMSIGLMNIQEAEEETDDDKLPESKRKKFAAAISSKYKALCASIGKSLDAISTKIAGEPGVSIDDYLSTKQGEIRMEQDIRKIQEEVKKAAIEGDKLVQAISKGFHRDPENVKDVVDKYINKTKEIFDKHSEAIITASAATAIYGAQISIYDNMMKHRGEDGIYQQCATMEDQNNVIKIKNAMANMYNKEMRIYSIFMNKFDKLSREGK